VYFDASQTVYGYYSLLKAFQCKFGWFFELFFALEKFCKKLGKFHHDLLAYNVRHFYLFQTISFVPQKKSVLLYSIRAINRTPQIPFYIRGSRSYKTYFSSFSDF